MQRCLFVVFVLFPALGGFRAVGLARRKFSEVGGEKDLRHGIARPTFGHRMTRMQHRVLLPSRLLLL